VASRTGGLELAGDHNPEYAIIDLRIGPDSGLELVKRLKAMDTDIRMVIPPAPTRSSTPWRATAGMQA